MLESHKIFITILVICLVLIVSMFMVGVDIGKSIRPEAAGFHP